MISRPIWLPMAWAALVAADPMTSPARDPAVFCDFFTGTSGFFTCRNFSFLLQLFIRGLTVDHVLVGCQER